MIEGFKQPCNLFLKKMTLIFPEPQMQQKRVHVFFFCSLGVCIIGSFPGQKGKSPLTIWRREAAKILREALHQKSMATPRKTGANPLWLRFSPLNHDQPPLFPKKRGSAFHSHFSQPKKYRLTTYHFNTQPPPGTPAFRWFKFGAQLRELGMCFAVSLEKCLFGLCKTVKVDLQNGKHIWSKWSLFDITYIFLLSVIF